MKIGEIQKHKGFVDIAKWLNIQSFFFFFFGTCKDEYGLVNLV